MLASIGLWPGAHGGSVCFHSLEVDVKIPTVIDLRKYGAKDFVQKIIDTYGKSRNVNEIGLEIHCITETGQKFQLLQFNRSRHLVTIGSSAE